MMILLQLFHFNHRNPKKEIEKSLSNAEQSKLCSCLKHKTWWDWLELLIVPLILAGMTILWNHRVDQQAADKERGQLVRNYISSITTLILDQYHHGKVDKFPEISVQEVGSFVRAKTANTLQALKKSDKKHKQNLINFLSEAGIGFFPPYKSDGYESRLLIQNICPIKDINIVNHIISQEKDMTFDDFFCKIELSNVVLNDLNLRAVIWEGANLTNAEMKGAILEKSDFQRAWLNKVDLTDANLNKANLKSAYLQEAILERTQLNQANLRDATLATPTIYKGQSKPTDTNLKNAQLKGVNLRGAKLGGVNFKNATMEPFCVTANGQEQQECTTETAEREILTNLRNTQLQGANLTGVNLKRANLRGAKLQDTNIRQASTLKGAIVDDETEFLKSIKERDEFIKQQNMIKIHRYFNKDQYTNKESEILNLSDVDLRGADLTEANLSGVDLRRADLRGAKMSNANLKGANLKDALYDDKTKLPSDFGLDQDAEASNRKMIKIIPGANLEKKDIRYADLSGVDLRNTQLQGAQLSHIDFDYETNWKDAEFDPDTKLPFHKDTAILRYKMKYSPNGQKHHYSQYIPIPIAVNWEGENRQKENLQNAILRGAVLKDTILKKAQLQKADLTEADLSDADLTGANLHKTTLTGVKLEGADLTDANLRGVIFTDEENFRQQLEDAVLCRTVLPTLSEDEDNDTNWKNSLENRDCLKAD